METEKKKITNQKNKNYKQKKKYYSKNKNSKINRFNKIQNKSDSNSLKSQDNLNNDSNFTNMLKSPHNLSNKNSFHNIIPNTNSTNKYNLGIMENYLKYLERIDNLIIDFNQNYSENLSFEKSIYGKETRELENMILLSQQICERLLNLVKLNLEMTNIKYEDLKYHSFNMEQLDPDMEESDKNMFELLSYNRFYTDSWSWSDISDRESNKELIKYKVNKLVKEEKFFKNNFTNMKNRTINNSYKDCIIYKKIENIEKCYLDENNINIPIITDLKQIPPSFYWFGGDKKYSEGIYTCLGKNFYVKVSLPDLTCPNDNNYKYLSEKCQYEFLNICLEKRKEKASKHNSEIRECNFAHKGDNYLKVLNPNKRPSLKTLGRYKSLKYDLDNLEKDDIRALLMDSLSDTMLSIIWFQNKYKKDENGDIYLKKENEWVIADLDLCS